MSDFIQVSQADFYQVINPLERLSFRPERMETLAMIDNRHVIGRKFPGYLCQCENGRYTEQKRFFLATEYAARIKRKKVGDA